MITSGEIRRDRVQQRAVDSLANLQVQLAGSGNRKQKRPKGVYLFGGVGCGKTFVMDLFYSTAPVASKKRVHFSSFMLDVHSRLLEEQKKTSAQMDGGFLSRVLPKIHEGAGGAAGGAGVSSWSFFGLKMTTGSAQGEYNEVDLNADDPLPKIARDIARETYLLCLDEFEVTDVADALILARLIDGLVKEGVVLVTTSNREPGELYLDGLNRHLFVPAIKLVEKTCAVVPMVEGSDYRRSKDRSGAESRFVFGEDAAANESRMDSLWATALQALGPDAEISRQVRVTHGSRYITAPTVASVGGEKKACRLTFKELCENNLNPSGAAEFALLGQTFDSIFIDDVPNFNTGGASLDGLRRFVLCVDALYDAKVELFFSASADITSLWDQSKDLTWEGKDSLGDLIGTAQHVPVDTHTRFSLDRTISRMLECTSMDYDATSKATVAKAAK
jgi:protein AFG1